MAEQRNGLKSVVVWLHDIFEALATHLQDVEAKKEVLRALGLDPAGASQNLVLPAGSMTSIRNYIARSDDDIDIEAFQSLVADIISVSQAIDAFIQIVTSSDDPAIANDFLDMLLQLYLMEAVRLRANSKEAKAFFQITKGINFYQELSVYSGGVFGFTRNIAGFVERVFKSFNAEDA